MQVQQKACGQSSLSLCWQLCRLPRTSAGSDAATYQRVSLLLSGARKLWQLCLDIISRRPHSQLINQTSD